MLILLLVIEVRLFNEDIIFLWWGRGYNKTPLVFQPMECWIIVVYTIGCMVTLKEVHAFYWINNNVLESYDMSREDKGDREGIPHTHPIT